MLRQARVGQGRGRSGPLPGHVRGAMQCAAGGCMAARRGLRATVPTTPTSGLVPALYDPSMVVRVDDEGGKGWSVVYLQGLAPPPPPPPLGGSFRALLLVMKPVRCGLGQRPHAFSVLPGVADVYVVVPHARGWGGGQRWAGGLGSVVQSGRGGARPARHLPFPSAMAVHRCMRSVALRGKAWRTKHVQCAGILVLL